MISFCTQLCRLVDTNIIYYRNIFCYMQFYAGIMYLLINLSKSKMCAFCILSPVCPLPAVDLLFRESNSQCQQSQIKLQYQIINNQK